MKSFFLYTVILFIGFTCVAQTVKLTNIDQIEKRIAAGADTVYVINFWATWCAPCVKELPYFEKLASTYAHHPLKVLLVSLDFKSKLEKEIIPFIKKHNLKTEVVLNEVVDQQFINRVDKGWSGALPATLIINKNKHIRKFYEKEFTFAELEDIYIKSLGKEVYK